MLIHLVLPNRGVNNGNKLLRDSIDMNKVFSRMLPCLQNGCYKNITEYIEIFLIIFLVK